MEHWCEFHVQIRHEIEDREKVWCYSKGEKMEKKIRWRRWKRKEYDANNSVIAYIMFAIFLIICGYLI